jgi:hypothetical protein
MVYIHCCTSLATIMSGWLVEGRFAALTHAGNHESLVLRIVITPIQRRGPFNLKVSYKWINLSVMLAVEKHHSLRSRIRLVVADEP